ncbi:MAG: tetratricopeptide repeat protein [Candidatus Cryptobacteroides sp.]
MKRLICSIALILCALLPLSAQSEKKEVRRGNSDYKKENYKDSEIHYRKALVQDSTSFAATYDLANTLYQQRDYEGADNTLKKIEEEATDSPHASKYYFNKGNTDLQKQDYAAAVEDFKQSLLRNPADIQAKESYIYAKKMLDNQNQGGQDGEQNQQDQKQDDQKQEQNQQDQQQNQQDQQNQQPQEQQISAQQAQQMLKAIQAKEKETQEKVEKMKAEKAKSRQKEKNW